VCATKIKVIIADADELLQRLYSGLVCRETDFEVTAQVSNGRQLFKAMQAGADLVLLDIYLPGFSALTGLSKLFTKFGNAGVIVLSAGNDKKIISGAFAAGVYDYLVKPFSFEKLRTVIRDYKKYFERHEDAGELCMADLGNIISRPNERDAVKEVQLGYFNSIEKLLSDSGTFSAQEVGDAIGVSRSTARRYLELLASAGRTTVEYAYRRAGRPEKRYRLTII
jgi:response regulator of citrate/malate metabolism